MMQARVKVWNASSQPAFVRTRCDGLDENVMEVVRVLSLSVAKVKFQAPEVDFEAQPAKTPHDSPISSPARRVSPFCLLFCF